MTSSVRILVRPCLAISAVKVDDSILCTLLLCTLYSVNILYTLVVNKPDLFLHSAHFAGTTLSFRRIIIRLFGRTIGNEDRLIFSLQNSLLSAISHDCVRKKNVQALIGTPVSRRSK